MRVKGGPTPPKASRDVMRVAVLALGGEQLLTSAGMQDADSALISALTRIAEIGGRLR